MGAKTCSCAIQPHILIFYEQIKVIREAFSLSRPFLANTDFLKKFTKISQKEQRLSKNPFQAAAIINCPRKNVCLPADLKGAVSQKPFQPSPSEIFILYAPFFQPLEIFRKCSAHNRVIENEGYKRLALSRNGDKIFQNRNAHIGKGYIGKVIEPVISVFLGKVEYVFYMLLIFFGSVGQGNFSEIRGDSAIEQLLFIGCFYALVHEI